jgi:integrase
MRNLGKRKRERNVTRAPAISKSGGRPFDGSRSQVNPADCVESRHSWRDAVERYKLEIAPGNISPSTAKRYAVSIRQLGDVWSERFVDEIDYRFLTEFVSRRNRAGTTNATVRRDLTAISSILGACQLWGWRDDNPARYFDRSFLRERRDPIDPPSDADIAKLVNVVPVNFGRAILFLRQTGMRQQEAVMLRWRQINLKRKVVQLIATKGGRPRAVPLDKTATATLVGTARYAQSDYVFWHHEGLPYRNFASRFRTHVRRAGVAFRCHDLRHKFAIEYLRSGGDIYKLSRVLGHRSVKTTELYLGFIP